MDAYKRKSPVETGWGRDDVVYEVTVKPKLLREDEDRPSERVIPLDQDEAVTVALNGATPADESDDPVRTLTIVNGTETSSKYWLTVSDDLSPHPEHGSEQEGSKISGTSAEGVVGSDPDSYCFRGYVEHFEIAGDATVYLDGEPVDPDSLERGEEGRFPRRITIDATDSPRGCDYQFSVTGGVETGIEASDDDVVFSTETDTISGTATGRTTHQFSGEVTTLTIDGAATIDFEDAD